MNIFFLIVTGFLFGAFSIYPKTSGGAICAAFGLYYILTFALEIPRKKTDDSDNYDENGELDLSKKNLQNLTLKQKLPFITTFFICALIGAFLGAGIIPMSEKFPVAVNASLSGLILGGGALFFRRAYLPVKPAFTLKAEIKKQKKAAALLLNSNDDDDTVTPVPVNKKNQSAMIFKSQSTRKKEKNETIKVAAAKAKKANDTLKKQLDKKFLDNQAQPDFSKAFNGLFVAILFLAITIIISLSVSSSGDAINVTQSASSTNYKIYVVTIENKSDFHISSWKLKYDGIVESAGGVNLSNDESFQDIISGLFYQDAQKEPNCFVPIGAASKISPGEKVSFTYETKKGSRLELESSVVYAPGATLLMLVAIAGFLGAFAMIFPGSAVNLIFTAFGVGATIESAFANFTPAFLIPLLLFMGAGIYYAGRFAAKIWRRKENADEWEGFYANCAFLGLQVGAAFCAFPRTLNFNIEFIIGIVLFGAFAAITTTVGSEIVSKEELAKTSKNLVK